MLPQCANLMLCMEENAAPSQSPVVTALILSHNSAPALRRAITALEASRDRASLEILVVDQGSRDGSQAMDNEYPDVTMLRLPRYFGATKARNIGVRTAKGEYVFLLAPEVEVRPETVSALIVVLESENPPGVACPLLAAPLGQALPQLSSMPVRGSLEPGPWRALSGASRETAELVSPRALFTRRQTIAGMNYFDERFGETWSDVDFCFRVHKGGRKIIICGDIPVTDHGAPAPTEAMRAALEADRRIGAAAFSGKHFGLGARISTYLKALAGAPFSPGGFSAFSRMLSGQKIDGSELLD
jgi:N-acetylglucosaminyl-diphospho-decaprenol L-rhamnosyltransferase